MTKALALSFLWYLGPSQLLSPRSENHLMEKINNYVFSLLRDVLWREKRMAPTFPILQENKSFHPRFKASWFLDYPCIIRLFAPVCVL